jgi:TrwC relaxase
MDNEKETVNRRVFYDFTFSPPKSVSIVAPAGPDERIVSAHDQAQRRWQARCGHKPIDASQAAVQREFLSKLSFDNPTKLITNGRIVIRKWYDFSSNPTRTFQQKHKGKYGAPPMLKASIRTCVLSIFRKLHQTL